MQDDLRQQLEIEDAKGSQYSSAWESMVEPFFKAKTEELYGRFLDVSVLEPDHLMVIKMQQNALASLKDEFEHYINTGTLARAALKEEDSNE